MKEKCVIYWSQLKSINPCLSSCYSKLAVLILQSLTFLFWITLSPFLIKIHSIQASIYIFLFQYFELICHSWQIYLLILRLILGIVCWKGIINKIIRIRFRWLSKLFEWYTFLWRLIKNWGMQYSKNLMWQAKTNVSSATPN